MYKDKAIKILMDNGYDEIAAKDKVDSVINKLTETGKIDDLSEEQIITMFKMAATKSDNKVDKLIGVCIGIDAKKDQNQRLIDAALKEAQNIYQSEGSYDKAVSNGIVGYKLDENGEVIVHNNIPLIEPIDNRAFTDKAGKNENKNQGKPFYPMMSRFAYFLVDGVIKTVKGNFDVEIGGEYTIYTRDTTRDMVFTVAPHVSYIRKLTNYEMWDLLMEYADDIRQTCSLMDIEDKNNYDIILTLGTVAATPRTKKGIPFVSLTDDEIYDNVSCFIAMGAEEELVRHIDTIKSGNEVIVLGKVRESNGEYPNSVTLHGIIVNPDSDEYANTFNEIAEMFVD